MTKKADEWGSSPKALDALREANNREINSKYLHILWRDGKLDRRPIDGRTFEYNLTQARTIKIAEKKGSGRTKQVSEDS